MPSSFRTRTRLEQLATFGFVGAVSLGAVTLIWRPQQVSNLLNSQQLSLPWVSAKQPNGQDTPLESLGLPLMGQQDRNKKTAPISVPPPVIPQILPPEPQGTQGRVQASPFTDLPASHWAYLMITELLNQNMISGFPDGTFRPDQPVTRAEFAAQLSRTFDLSLGQGVESFADVTDQNWANQDIRTAVQMGFLKGYPEDKFFPDQTITRIQVLSALAKGLNIKSSSSSKAVLRYYHDYEQIPEWAIRPLVAATEAGLVVNHPDVSRLAPNRPANRAEVTAMLYRALVYIGHLEDVSSPHWVQPEPMP